MILINLLPPELRKKRGTVNPMIYGVAAAWLVAIAPLLGWAHLSMTVRSAAQADLDNKTAELADKTAKAKAVADMETEIAAAEAQLASVEALVSQKMYWAPLIDDFANHMTSQWPGFEVSCTDFSIQMATKTGQASRGRKRGDATEASTASLKGRFKLLGNDFDKAGDYIHAFFANTQASPFWINNGFVGRPSSTYKGDTPAWVANIGRVAVELNLEWTRSKVGTQVAATKAVEGR